jgi:protein-L-isoaspartate(D-aspartate) O-methyltransferase
MICADGRLGFPEFGPYNAIHVGAAVEIVPNALLQQLSPDGGQLLIPVGPVGE